MRIEIELEDDGRRIAEVNDLPGVMGHGQSREEAISKVEVLALRVITMVMKDCEGERVTPYTFTQR